MYAVNESGLTYIHKIIQIDTKYAKFKFLRVMLNKIQIFLDIMSWRL